MADLNKPNAEGGANPPTGFSAKSEPISITVEDLQGAEVTQRVADMERARQVALVRDVGAPGQSSGGGALRAIGILTAGGAIGGVAAFLFTRLLFDVLGLFQDNTFVTNMGFTFIMAFFIGTCVAFADVVSSRTWSKLGVVAAVAIPAALGAALVMGLIAHFFYSAATESIYEAAFEQAFTEDWTEQQVMDYVILRLHPVRGFAWLLVGVAAGVAAGAAARSWKRTALAAAGGAVGGFLGGFIFDFFPLDWEWVSQAVGMTLTGLLIGLAMGLVEQASKSRWIEIVSGGLAGKQFILYKPVITVGSSPSADITLIKDPAIPEIVATLDTRGGQSKITAANPQIPIVVNGTTQFASVLLDGDTMTFGSTQIRFREKASRSQVPGALKT